VIEPGTPVPEPEVYDGKGSAPLPVFFQGRTLLFFFAAECERCAGVLPLMAQWRTAGTNVVGISQETIEDTAEFLQEVRYSIPVVIDDRPYPASRVFEIEQLPSIALVDNDVVEWTSDGCSVEDLAAARGLLGISKELPEDDLGAGRASKHL